MLLLLAEYLTPFISGFNALTYLTLRGDPGRAHGAGDVAAARARR